MWIRHSNFNKQDNMRIDLFPTYIFAWYAFVINQIAEHLCKPSTSTPRVRSKRYYTTITIQLLNRLINNIICEDLSNLTKNYNPKPQHLHNHFLLKSDRLKLVPRVRSKQYYTTITIQSLNRSTGWYFGLAHEGTYVRLGLNDHLCKTFNSVS